MINWNYYNDHNRYNQSVIWYWDEVKKKWKKDFIYSRDSSQYLNQFSEDDIKKLNNEFIEFSRILRNWLKQDEINCTEEIINKEINNELSSKIIIKKSSDKYSWIEKTIINNLKMYPQSIFKEELKIFILNWEDYEKSHKWIWITYFKWKWKPIWIVLNWDKFHSTTIHHELIHYLQYQEDWNLDEINQVIYTINEKYLKTMKDKSLLFVHDYSTSRLWEEPSTIHENLMMLNESFMDKLKKSDWLKEKIEWLYWIQMNQDFKEWKNWFFWKKLNSQRYFNRFQIEKWWKYWWLTSYSELNSELLNKIQNIRVEINNCILWKKKW